MAEANKSGILAKAQKRLSRTKTKVLQTLGKADKSSDESFDELVQKTEKQHDVAHHLQKEFKSYLHCMRALCNASKSLASALSQTYEEEWTDEDDFKKSLQCEDLLWNDYLDSMQSAVMEPLNTYLASFPALKTKIAKRGRKMVDFDNSRHNLEVLQAAKKRDEAKIAKAQDDLNDSKKIFEDLHNELCAELPEFYNSRVTFYAELFQKFFGCENRLHTEIGKVSQSMADTAQRLSKDFVHFVYTPKRPLSKSPSDNAIRTENSTFYYGSEEQQINGDSSPRGGTDSPASSASPAATPTTPSAVARPTAGGAAAVAALDATAAAAVDEDTEEAEEADEDHLYGNQDAVTAAAKVNGDTEKVQEILDQELENKTLASSDSVDPVSQDPVAATTSSAADYANPASAIETSTAADYAVPSDLPAVSLSGTSRSVSSDVITAPISSDSNALPCFLSAAPRCSPPVPIVAQPTLASPFPGTMCQPPPSLTTSQINLLEQVPTTSPETALECSGDYVGITTEYVTENYQDNDDKKGSGNNVVEHTEGHFKKESKNIFENSPEKDAEKPFSDTKTGTPFEKTSSEKVINSSHEIGDENPADSVVKLSQEKDVEIYGKVDSLTAVTGQDKEITCTDQTKKDLHSSTADPHTTLSLAHSEDFIDNSFEQEIDNALLEGITGSQEHQAAQARDLPSLSTQSSCLSFNTEECEEAMLFVDKTLAPEAEFDTDTIDSKCSELDNSTGQSETPLSHKNLAPSVYDSRPTFTISDSEFSPCPANIKHHDNEELDESRPVSITSEFETLGETVSGKQNCEHLDESRPMSNSSEFETFGEIASDKEGYKKELIHSSEGTCKSASSALRPLSVVSDFETLDVASDGRKTHEREQDKKTSRPEQWLDSFNYSELSLAKSLETKTAGNTSSTDSNIMSSWDPVPPMPSAASIGALITSSFSDFSASCKSSKGEIHQNVTFSSQEDLVSTDRSRGSLEPSNLATSLGTSLESCGSIPAEEKSIISALEKAIMEETSTDTKTDSSQLKENTSLMEVEQTSQSLPSTDDTKMPVAKVCYEESTDADECHQPDHNSYKAITGEACDTLRETEAWKQPKGDNVGKESFKHQGNSDAGYKSLQNGKSDGSQILQITSSNRSGRSNPPEKDMHTHRIGVHTRSKPPLSSPVRNLNMGGAGQFLATSHHSLPGKKGIEQELSKDSAEKSKLSFTHRGIQMFKSMLHITSKGEKNTRAAKSVDLEDSQKGFGDQPDERKKGNACDSQNMVIPSTGTKGSKRKSSPTSHTHSPTPGNMKKEKKSDGLAKTPKNPQKVKSSTFPRKEDQSDTTVAKIPVSGKKDKSKDSLKMKKKSDTLPNAKDFVKREESDMQEDNTGGEENSDNQLKKDMKRRNGSKSGKDASLNTRESASRSSRDFMVSNQSGRCVTGGNQRAQVNSSNVTTYASEKVSSSDLSTGHFSKGTLSTAQTGSLRASVGVLDLNFDNTSMRQLQAVHGNGFTNQSADPSLTVLTNHSGSIQSTESNIPQQPSNCGMSMPDSDGNKIGPLPYDRAGQHEDQGSEPKTMKKTLNPLAPPFTMPSSHSRHLPVPSPLTPSATGPVIVTPTQQRLTLPHSQVRGLGERSSKGQQWHNLSTPSAGAAWTPEVRSHVEDCNQIPSLPIGTMPARTPVISTGNRSALGGRRSHPSSIRPDSRETLNRDPLSQLPVPSPQSVYLAAPYNYLHADLEVPGFQHAGDVVIGTQSILMSSVQGNLVKEEVSNQGLANNSVVGLHGETEKGEGDVCVKQVTPPAEAKKLVVMENVNTVEPQQSSRLSENKVTQKLADAMASSTVTTSTAAVLSHDLDLAREAWRKAWKTSNVAETEPSESSLAVEGKGDAEASCMNTEEQSQVRREDSFIKRHEVHTNQGSRVSTSQEFYTSKPDDPGECLDAKHSGDSTETELPMQIVSSSVGVKEIIPDLEIEAPANLTLQIESPQSECSTESEDTLLLAEEPGPYSRLENIKLHAHARESIKSTEAETVGGGAITIEQVDHKVLKSEQVEPDECVLLQNVHDTSKTKVHFIEQSYHVSDGFETLMNDTGRSPVMDEPTIASPNKTHVAKAPNVDTPALESDKHGSLLSIPQTENVQEPIINVSQQEAEIQGSQDAIADVTSTTIRQANNEWNRSNFPMEVNSVDVTACDSAITAHWETYYIGHDTTSLHQQQVDAATSNEVVTACDSGISTSDVSHSVTDVNIEVSHSRTSMVNHTEGVSPILTNTLSTTALAVHHQWQDSTGEVKVQSQEGIMDDVALQHKQQHEEKSGELNGKDDLSEDYRYDADRPALGQTDSGQTHEKEEIRSGQMLTKQETDTEQIQEKYCLEQTQQEQEEGLEQTDKELETVLEQIPIEQEFELDQTFEKHETVSGPTNTDLETGAELTDRKLESGLQQETGPKQYDGVQIAVEQMDAEATDEDQRSAEVEQAEAGKMIEERKNVEQTVEQMNAEEKGIEQKDEQKAAVGQINAVKIAVEQRVIGKISEDQADAEKTNMEEMDSVTEQMDTEKIVTNQVGVRKTAVEQTYVRNTAEEKKVVITVEEETEKTVVMEYLEQTVGKQNDTGKKTVTELKHNMKMNEMQAEQQDIDRNDAEQTCAELVPVNPAEPVVSDQKEPTTEAGNFNLLQPNITPDTSVTLDGKIFSSVKAYVEYTVETAASAFYTASIKNGSRSLEKPEEHDKLLKPDITMNSSVTVDRQMFPCVKSVVECAVVTASDVFCNSSMEEGSTAAEEPEENMKKIAEIVEGNEDVETEEETESIETEEENIDIETVKENEEVEMDEENKDIETVKENKETELEEENKDIERIEEKKDTETVKENKGTEMEKENKDIGRMEENKDIETEEEHKDVETVEGNKDIGTLEESKEIETEEENKDIETVEENEDIEAVEETEDIEMEEESKDMQTEEENKDTETEEESEDTETVEESEDTETVEDNRDIDKEDKEDSVDYLKKEESKAEGKTLTEDTGTHSPIDVTNGKADDEKEIKPFQNKIPELDYCQDNIVSVRQPFTEDVRSSAGDELEPDRNAVTEDAANLAISELEPAVEMNTNASATVVTMHEVDAGLISSQDPVASDCERSDSIEMMFSKGDTSASLHGYRGSQAVCDWVGHVEAAQQMNALSQAKPESSTVTGPAAATNNVYEEPQGNGEEEESDEEDESDLYQSPPSNKPVVEPPPNTMYQVEATNLYKGEEIDELSFEPGDIIYVVSFDNEEEQDEGWQMGIKQKDGMKGVFPENFTRKV